jgi:hypothetical protein
MFRALELKASDMSRVNWQAVVTNEAEDKKAP